MPKVTVMSADQAKFRPFRWWSNWVDVAVYTHDRKMYLLQMSISKTNRKRFVSTDVTGNNNYYPRSIMDVGDLIQMEIASHAPKGTLAAEDYAP